MKKIVLAVGMVLFLLLCGKPIVSVADDEWWVYDEIDVVSEETEEFITALNEVIFPTYEKKPQLGIMVIESLPYGYTIDEFKLEMFNKLGVGTEENCGMLFVFAINDRAYGMEIGEGFVRGSVLRQDLETDFITEDMKVLLREGLYDDVIYQVAEYLGSVMKDEEDGVYIWKEQERLLKLQEEQRRQEEFELKTAKGLYNMIRVMLYILVGSLVLAIVLVGGYGIIELFRTVRRKRIAEELVEQNYRHVRLIGVPQERIIDYVRNSRGEVAIKDLETEFISLLYDLYCIEVEDYIDTAELPHPSEVYMEYFRECNTREVFAACAITDVERIIRDVNQKEEQKLKLLHENQQMVCEFVDAKTVELAEMGLSAEGMKESLVAQCRYGQGELSMPVLRKRYDDEIKEQLFQRDYELFLEENKDKIDSRYFDARTFYNTVRNSKEGREHSATNYSWMLPLLMFHMSDNRRVEEARIQKRERARAEEARRSQQSSSSIGSTSFGSSFGGGFSRGGGFSGGW